MSDAQTLWTRCSATVRAHIPEGTWLTCLSAARPVALEGHTLTLAVPSFYARDRIEERYRDHIEALLASAWGSPVTLRVVIDTDLTSPADADLEHRSEDHPLHALSADPAPPARATSFLESTLDPRYTFDAFVTGPSNRFPHAAALSVAETPARSYNPLFIHGGAGLGKTHLLHAIGNYVRENYPAQRVRYVSTETFLNEFVDAIRTNTTTAFKRRYRECDVLLVDDVQFLENKESLQEEFFYTFNSLYEASKQIVITSDRPPRAIKTLEDRLRSRFDSGLTADVQPPELETRLAILRKKAEREHTNVPDEVLELIAEHVTDNIRELEGALTRVSAFASLNGATLDRELAKHILSDIIVPEKTRPITPQIILEATARHFGFTVDDLRGTSRRRPLVIARQIGMYVCRDLTDYSYPAIGREFGNRDHTTVMHAVEKIAALMRERRQIFDQVTELTRTIKNNT